MGRADSVRLHHFRHRMRNARLLGLYRILACLPVHTILFQRSLSCMDHPERVCL